MTAIITIENLGKCYTIRHRQKDRYRTLRDDISNGVRSLFSGVFSKREKTPSKEIFWALKAVDMDVAPGDRLGIIGRNGAGKSTLLKLIARITAPSTGRIRIRGRVASLLEVGTGFHPELTGRENIFLNGAILGMRRDEIRAKFDEIVAFAEIARFLDTPVKRYSSGMYVRLAFAVAAHLDPEILIIDEVLAVGDAAFQKKCIGKMRKIQESGRTILFVSHNMQSVVELCNRAVVLNEGCLIFAGSAEDAVTSYIDNVDGTHALSDVASVLDDFSDDALFKYEDIAVTQDGQPVVEVDSNRPLDIEIAYTVKSETTGLRVYFDLCDTENNILCRSFHDELAEQIPVVPAGSYVSRARIAPGVLAPRDYELRIHATVFNVRAIEPRNGVCLRLSVGYNAKKNAAYFMEPIRGKLFLPIDWKTETIRGA